MAFENGNGKSSPINEISSIARHDMMGEENSQCVMKVVDISSLSLQRNECKRVYEKVLIINYLRVKYV